MLAGLPPKGTQGQGVPGTGLPRLVHLGMVRMEVVAAPSGAQRPAADEALAARLLAKIESCRGFTG